MANSHGHFPTGFAIEFGRLLDRAYSRIGRLATGWVTRQLKEYSALYARPLRVNAMGNSTGLPTGCTKGSLQVR